MEKNRIFNLIIFGNENSGKSTLLNLISKKENLFNVNNNNNNKNKDFISKKVKLNNNNFNFIETIGINPQFKINNINNKIINFKENFLNKNYKIVLITIDVTNENNFDAFEKIMNVFSFYNSKENLFIVLTKGNLIKNEEKREEKYLNITNDLKKFSNNFSINFNNVFFADDENINNLINKIISTSKDKNSDLCYISIKNQTENDNLNILKKLFISKEELNNNFISEENEENFLISFFKKLINENYFYNNPNLLL